MGHVMTTRSQLLGPAAFLFALVGCASSEATAPSAAITPEESATGTVHPQGDSPPAAAQTPCGDAVRGQVQGALGLDAVPAPGSTWADNRSTCAYQTPLGPLVFSVMVEANQAAAQDHLEALRTELQATSPLTGLKDAYQNGLGAVVALQDNLVLHVDASALPPEHLGPDHQTQTGLAIILAEGVVNGWTGQG
jgi:hypothetical protein